MGAQLSQLAQVLKGAPGRVAGVLDRPCKGPVWGGGHQGVEPLEVALCGTSIDNRIEWGPGILSQNDLMTA